jgi:hypothetical protein
LLDKVLEYKATTKIGQNGLEKLSKKLTQKELSKMLNKSSDDYDLFVLW